LKFQICNLEQLFLGLRNRFERQDARTARQNEALCVAYHPIVSFFAPNQRSSSHGKAIVAIWHFRGRELPVGLQGAI
jgi:hypothetical protein